MAATGDSPCNQFSPEVCALCAAGAASFNAPWRNYVLDFRLDSHHIPELLQIAQASIQDKDGDENGIDQIGIWAELHARRALGELRVVDVMETLIALAEVDEGVVLDLPIIAALVGPGAIPSLVGSLQRRVEDDDTIQTVAIEALSLVARWHNEAREEIANILCWQLQAYPNQPRNVNGALIASLKGYFADMTHCRKTIDEVTPLTMYYTDYCLHTYPSTRERAIESGQGIERVDSV